MGGIVKTCFKCGQCKPIEMFHKHPQMRDGHLNKCAACTVRDVAEWRKKQPPGLRAKEYQRALESGRETRKAPQKHGKDPVLKRTRGAKYTAAKRAGRRLRTELDVFVFDECVALNALREKATGLKWSVDHIVPFRHLLACGLHVAANIQSVPYLWNGSKGHRGMETFFPRSY